MGLLKAMSIPLALSAMVAISAGAIDQRATNAETCSQIGAALSSASGVFTSLDLTGSYFKDNYHWASSSSQTSACSVEPGTVQDVATILRIVKGNQTPFAVKGGGHIANPEFSSTTGVQIAMYRFSEVTYNSASQTVVVGAGLVWDSVYAALQQHNVNVVGGRVSGVGVAGFTLGGGYSWKTNQYGLTVDNIVAFELVKPDGTATNVTSSSDKDLFWALKGGFNNFGIVTRFTFKTYPQTQVWGGLETYTMSHVQEALDAVNKFQANVKDPKAGAITALNYVLGQPGISQLLFYDGPEPPSGIFDDFLAIPSFTSDVDTRQFSDLISSAPANATGNVRTIFHTVALEGFSDTLLTAILNETNYWGSYLSLRGATFISYDIEPFLTNILSHGTDSAYPPTRAKSYLPLNLYFAWGSDLADEVFHNAIKQSVAQIKAVAIAEGQDIADAPLYPNYAVYDTPLEQMYGGNLAKLKQVRQRVDPEGVMNLAGTWKF